MLRLWRTGLGTLKMEGELKREAMSNHLGWKEGQGFWTANRGKGGFQPEDVC